MTSDRWRHAVVPGVSVKVAGGLLLLGGLALPWATVALGPRTEAGLERGDARPPMRVLPAGAFTMGSPTGEEGRFEDESAHLVQLETSFALSLTEVTQAQYERVMGENPSVHRGPDLPVDTVSWFDAIHYCNRLSEIESLEPCYDVDGSEVTWPKGAACLGYRLPTEAEWEYAARAGSSLVYAGADEPARVAWYADNAQGTTHVVGRRVPNAWGFHDMSGNLWEWVWDRYGDYPLGSYRVLRGGSFGDPARLVRIAMRNRDRPSNRDGYLGFRVARSFPSSR